MQFGSIGRDKPPYSILGFDATERSVLFFIIIIMVTVFRPLVARLSASIGKDSASADTAVQPSYCLILISLHIRDVRNRTCDVSALLNFIS